MLKIETLVFNPFQENTYLLSDQNGSLIIIDAGNYTPAENKRLEDKISSEGLKPAMVLNTHGHVDHILGINFLKNSYNIPFAVDGRDAFLIEVAQSHGRSYGFEIESTPEIDVDIKGEKEIKVGDIVLQVIETPGHTPGHVSFFHEPSRSLFTGDTLFNGSIGRTDLPGGDYPTIIRSILEKIVPLGEDVTVYAGHGPSTTIGHEVLYNPFITEVLSGEFKC